MDQGYPEGWRAPDMAGVQGTFVIAWAQTEIDGAVAAPLDALAVGAVWRWRGEAVRIDGPSEMLMLHDREDARQRRARAARVVRRLMGAALAGRPVEAMPEDDPDVPQQGFTVTDGRTTYAVAVIEVAGSAGRLVMFHDQMPPRDTDLWVVQRRVERAAPVQRVEGASGVICFTPGTMILTPEGPREIEGLRPGDRVMTKDNGAQDILWTGRRRMTGARLFAMPEYRPIRIRAGAMGAGRPEGDLIVSPGHRMLVEGAAARALFNAAEVLVSARDLVNGRSVQVETSLREVTYIHLLTEAHQIIWANGLETESFHPANADMGMLEANERAALLAMMPELEADPFRYGPHARRNLSAPEAAILRRDAA
ncbi:MAG: hypothetical protein RLZZ528_323 [Pseudomonadota bacterium]